MECAEPRQGRLSISLRQYYAQLLAAFISSDSEESWLTRMSGITTVLLTQPSRYLESDFPNVS